MYRDFDSDLEYIPLFSTFGRSGDATGEMQKEMVPLQLVICMVVLTGLLLPASLFLREIPLSKPEEKGLMDRTLPNKQETRKGVVYVLLSSLPALPKYPLRYPKYHLIKTIRPLTAIRCGVLVRSSYTGSALFLGS